jgi:hypothetical protein
MYNNEEVEMAVCEGCECKSLISVAIEFSNACQDGTNGSVCSRIMLKIIDTSLE